jgi:hypothetical protein
MLLPDSRSPPTTKTIRVCCLQVSAMMSNHLLLQYLPRKILEDYLPALKTIAHRTKDHQRQPKTTRDHYHQDSLERKRVRFVTCHLHQPKMKINLRLLDSMIQMLINHHFHHPLDQMTKRSLIPSCHLDSLMKKRGQRHLA